MFGSSWGQGEATIVARNAKYSGDGSVATHEFVADVRPVDGPPFRASIHEPTIATDFWPPNIGDVVSVLIKSKDGKVKFDKDDERLSAKAFEKRTKQAFEDLKNQPVGPSAGSTPAWGAAAGSTPAGSTPAWGTAWSATEGLPDSVVEKLAPLGFAPGTPMQVLGRDSAQAQSVLAAFGMGATAATNEPTAGPSTEARLQRLASLHGQGLLTDAEYAAQRERILGEL